jgi:gamma-glutamylcyclotransferase (GGCT)/AIG2-like uncharacterized protein YtfP
MVSEQAASLFIYGTLHPDRAPAAIAATARRLKPVGKATIRGRRYDLGEYPGVVLSDDPAEIVSGELFLLPEGPKTAEVLARLDAYEDYRPNDPANSLFLRQMTTAMMEDGSRRQCWVYTYNGALG